MRIVEAIKLLNRLRLPLKTRADHNTFLAVKLGIEALERHEARSTLTFAGMMQPLPGETIDLVSRR